MFLWRGERDYFPELLKECVRQAASGRPVVPWVRTHVRTAPTWLPSPQACFCLVHCESRVWVTFPRWNIGGEWRPPFQLPAGGAGWGPTPSLVLPMASGGAFVQWPGV